MTEEATVQGTEETAEGGEKAGHYHREMLEAFEAERGAEAGLVARMGCVMQALHISTSMLGDSHEAQLAKNEMYQQVMAMLSHTFNIDSETQTDIHELVVNITNRLAKDCGFPWTIGRPPEEGDSREGDSPIVVPE